MRNKKQEALAGIWVAVSIVLVLVAVNTAPPTVYLPLMFTLLMLTILASAYVLLGSIRKVGRVGRYAADSSEAYRIQASQQLEEIDASIGRVDEAIGTSLAQIGKAQRNGEGARARAATTMNGKLNAVIADLRELEATMNVVDVSVRNSFEQVGRAQRDSEGARARAATMTNGKLNAVMADVRELESLVERLQQLALGSQDQLLQRGEDRLHLADDFTRHTVKLEMYLDEIRAGMARPSSSHKDDVLNRVFAGTN